MSEELVFKTVIEAASAAKTLGEVKKSIRDINAELDKVPVGSKAFGELTTALGKAKANLTDLREQVRALDPEKRFAAIAQVGSTIASGFAAAQGAMALFGSKSEDLQKILVRVQAAMALAQGLQGLAGFSKALETARLAMIAFAMSNPFTAIAAGVVALGVAIAAIVISMDDTEKQLNELRTEAEAFEKSMDATDKFWSRRIKLLKAQGATIEEIAAREREMYRQKLEDIDTAINQQQALVDGGDKAAIDKLNALNEQKKDILLEQQLFELRVIDETAARVGERWDKKEQLFEKEQNRIKEASKKRKEAADKLWQEAQEEALRQTLIEDERNEREKKKQQELHEQLLAEQDKFIAETIARWEDELRYKNAVKDAELNIEKAKWDGMLTLAGIGEKLSGKNKALANTFFAIEKGLAIANIIVSTKKEIAGYWANPTWKLSPDGGIALATAASIAAKIRAATSIASIVATSVQKFIGGGGSAGDLGSSGGGGGDSVPNLSSPQSTENTFQQQDATKTNIDEKGDFTGFQSGGRMQQPIKAYVIESELTDVQRTINRIENNSKF